MLPNDGNGISIPVADYSSRQFSPGWTQFDPATGSPDSAPANIKRDRIPAEWNTMSEKEFEVPPGGTDKANFDIVTKS